MIIPSTALNRIKDLVKYVKKELVHFLFPIQCLHCLEIEIEYPFLFCDACKELIERFPIEECTSFQCVAVTREGASLSLLKEAQTSDRKEVFSSIAALMVVQMRDLNWPFPDLIIVSPKNPVQNGLLAQHLGDLLQVPFCICLSSDHRWIRFELCSDKVVLVADLTLSFSDSWHVLKEADPSAIYHIGFINELV